MVYEYAGTQRMVARFELPQLHFTVSFMLFLEFNLSGFYRNLQQIEAKLDCVVPSHTALSRENQRENFYRLDAGNWPEDHSDYAFENGIPASVEAVCDFQMPVIAECRPQTCAPCISSDPVSWQIQQESLFSTRLFCY